MTDEISYRAIGVVESGIHDALRPEVMRGVEARLVLTPEFGSAVAALEVGAYLWVVYHLHQSESWREALADELFRRRMACRPNPIGMTLTRILALEGSTITVIGLDTVDESPILDIKPYKPVLDAPPVEPSEGSW